MELSVALNSRFLFLILLELIIVDAPKLSVALNSRCSKAFNIGCGAARGQARAGGLGFSLGS